MFSVSVIVLIITWLVTEKTADRSNDGSLGARWFNIHRGVANIVSTPSLIRMVLVRGFQNNTRHIHSETHGENFSGKFYIKI